MDNIPLKWAQDVLKFSLTAAASLSVSHAASKDPELSNPDDPGKDPRFRKLVEAILFSRKFAATYNLALLAILVLFTVWNWSEKLALTRRQRIRAKKDGTRNDVGEHGIDEGWSSSSSTIEGTATPPGAAKKDAVDESSPLLAAGPSRHRALGFRRPHFALKAFLQYQPQPVPIIYKTLPPNSTSLLVLAFLALNAFYNFYKIPLSLQYVFVFADRCGILFSANLPLLYLLAAKNQPLKLLTGQSYESLNIFHRRVGELLCFEALLHFLGMMFVWYGLLRHLGFTLARFLLNRLVGLGLGAFASYEILYFTSLSSFRQRWYEIFLTSHIFLQTAGLVLLWFHHPTSRPYVGAALAIFLIDRFIFRIWLKSTSHPATLTVLEDEETILLSADWDVKSRGSHLLPHSMESGWEPNEHIFLTIPALSTKYVFQSHPFTIFSAAPGPCHTIEHQGNEHAWFSLLIRAQKPSGFTHALLDYARLHVNTRIRLDGPYGSSHALDMLQNSDNAIIVAGGSGIAVAYPLLWALLHPKSASTLDVEPGMTMAQSRKVKLLWITHSASHRSWIPEAKMQELQSWGLELLVPGPTSEIGRPNVRKMLDAWVSGADRTDIVVSGPDGLVRDVRNAAAGFIARGEDVGVQVEKFGW